jgi:hypothetical protein
MHRSALGDLLIDVDPAAHDRALEFWRQATGSTLRPLGEAGAHTRLKGPWSAVALTMQRLVEGDSRVHFDVMTDDVAAETARLESLGATRDRSMDGWEIMRDPAGLVFCVIPAAFVGATLTDDNSVAWG